MADKKDFVIKEEENGIVNIGEEVIAIIAGLAATEVDGVVSLVGNLTNELISKAGGSKLAKGIKVVTNESDKIAVKVAVNISYGYEIPIICQQIQEKVKASVENMTGLDVVSVDVKIASVDVANE
ncbi:MAG: Asp23/Gls24 family envelope stress response protein [Lachnospiraceae bacterium]|nr:Asp23/Gls24 family envelope stress response protein [Lachnospiraceae bacterium]